jgi:hypothetical protein
MSVMTPLSHNKIPDTILIFPLECGIGFHVIHIDQSIDQGVISLREGEIEVPREAMLSSSPEGLKEGVHCSDNRGCLLNV